MHQRALLQIPDTLKSTAAEAPCFLFMAPHSKLYQNFFISFVISRRARVLYKWQRWNALFSALFARVSCSLIQHDDDYYHYLQEEVISEHAYIGNVPLNRSASLFPEEQN
jgi:hypothetical protein